MKTLRLPALAALAAGLVLSLLAGPARGFSAAENAARLQPLQHLGYLALVQDGQLDALKGVEKPAFAGELLAAAGVGNFAAFTIEVDGRSLYFAHHTLAAGAQPGGAWAAARANAALGPWIEKTESLVDPHPRAAADSKWLRLEQVFYHRGPADRKPGAQARRLAAITGLKPEMEFQYRTLHQTTWPGVLETMDKGNIANFTIYLFELGEKLYLIYYFDYLGDDFAADMAAGGKDPVSQRWWKHTDPCQQPLPAAAAKKQIWTDLTPLP